MLTPQEMIAAKLERSAFVLTFETEEVIAYRSGRQHEELRALYIDLNRRTAEYEVTQGGRPIRRRVEYFPTMLHLIEKLPVTIASFDLKFQGLTLEDNRRAAEQPKNRIPLAGSKDPWDQTNYYEKPNTGRPQRLTSLKLVDDEFR
jgi:hypothetical protein